MSLPSLTTSPSASLSYSSLLPSLSSPPSAFPERSSAYFLASSPIASPPVPTISASSLASSSAFCLCSLLFLLAIFVPLLAMPSFVLDRYLLYAASSSLSIV